MQDCRVCGKKKKNEYFYKHKAYQSGYDFKCKKCRSYEQRSKFNSCYMYIIKNKAWDGFLKIGRSTDVHKRLKSYQTSSPFRDYELVHFVKVYDAREVEIYIEENYNCMNEWIEISEQVAISIIEKFKYKNYEKH